jgi:hypothetical protein
MSVEATAQLPDEQPVVTASSPRRGRWRTWVATILIVIFAILAPLSVVAIWTRDEVGDTNRYVATVTPLASHPDVQAAVTKRITNEIVTRLNVPELLDQTVEALGNLGLPPRLVESLTSVATPLVDGVQTFVHDRVAAFVSSDAFEQAWIAANRQAHTSMVAALTGNDSGTVTVDNGAVSVNLATVINAIKAELVAGGFRVAAAIPAVDAQFVIFESKNLDTAQDAFRVLNALAYVLPILALLFAAGAIYVARSRRKALLHTGLALAVSMLVLGVLLNISRAVYLNELPDTVSQPAARAVFDTLVEFIRLNLRALLVAGLAVAIGAWLTGPSSSAIATRSWFSSRLGSARGRVGVEPGPIGAFAYRYRTPLRIGIVSVAVLLYVAAAHPTGASTLKILIVMIAALVVLEVVAAPPAAEPNHLEATGQPQAHEGAG